MKHFKTPVALGSHPCSNRVVCLLDDTGVPLCEQTTMVEGVLPEMDEIATVINAHDELVGFVRSVAALELDQDVAWSYALDQVVRRAKDVLKETGVGL